MPRYAELIPKVLFRSHGSGSFRTLVIGNCQAEHMADFLQIALADCACDYLACDVIGSDDRHAAVEDYLKKNEAGYRLILSLPFGQEWHSISRAALVARFGVDRLFFLPDIRFSGLFPDQTGLDDAGIQTSIIGGLHSIVALGGWMAQLPVPEILKLFTVENFAAFGFLEMFAESEREFHRREAECDTRFTDQLVHTVRTSFAFYTASHPTPNLLARFIDHVRNRLVARGQAQSSDVPLNAMLASGTLVKNGVWPIYPELKELVASHHLLSTYFILPERAGSPEAISRETFVERSITLYERAGREAIARSRQAVTSLDLVRRVVR
jgi:hypothetical protein